MAAPSIKAKTQPLQLMPPLLRRQAPITNTAVVDPDNTIAESNELNNTSATVNTSVGGTPVLPLLEIHKTDNNPNVYPWSTGAGPDPVNPGQKLTYRSEEHTS